MSEVGSLRSGVRLCTRCFTATALLLGLISLIGCGQEAYQVSGRVQYKDGTPITGGLRIIRFEPAQDTTAEIRKAASSEIAGDGSFELHTRKPGDGVYPGKYVVTFTVRTTPFGGKSLVARRFTRRDETPFDIVVDEDKKGLLFELQKQ
jgi:hypothetical protein